MRSLLAALLLLFFAASPAVAAPECSVSATAAGLHGTYDPFAPLDMAVDLVVTAVNAGDHPCLVHFYVAPLGGATRLTAAGSGLDYRVDGPNGGSLPNERGPFNLNIPGGASRSITIRFIIRLQQIVPQGSYTGGVQIRGEGPANLSIPVAGSSPVMTIDVPARSEMSISGAAAPPLSAQGMAPASIIFPDAHTGQSQHVFVNVWANSSVVITLTSENGGVLRHMADPSLLPISYSATFDGVAVGLGGSWSVTRAPPMTTQGASYPLAVTLGDTNAHFAGQYRDTITINVTAN